MGPQAHLHSQDPCDRTGRSQPRRLGSGYRGYVSFAKKRLYPSFTLR
ncbi:hypothetical protein C4K26_1589 [Pseudomonas chlororaphis]|nr:hypothetical protein C4K26_1589 [Pseudomonas chlororaphis]